MALDNQTWLRRSQATALGSAQARSGLLRRHFAPFGRAPLCGTTSLPFGPAPLGFAESLAIRAKLTNWASSEGDGRKQPGGMALANETFGPAFYGGTSHPLGALRFAERLRWPSAKCTSGRPLWDSRSRWHSGQADSLKIILTKKIYLP